MNSVSGVKLDKSSLSSINAQGIINQEMDDSRVSHAMIKYHFCVRTIVQSIFKRVLSDSSGEITAGLLFYLDLRSIIMFNLVAKEFINLTYIINKIDILLISAQSHLVIDARYKVTRPIKIIKEMINELPVYRYDGPIEVVSSFDDVNRIVNILSKETSLGFDVETRPAFKKGQSYLPSLIQLASRDKVFIVQLCSQQIELFKPLFENKNILKVGIGVFDDIKQLQKLGPFKPGGFVDVAQLKICKMIHNKGLQALAAFLLEVQIAKSKKIQLSNWANYHLTKAQIIYAATDAWISRELYIKLNQSV